MKQPIRYQFGLTGQPLRDGFELSESKGKRLARLLKMKEADLIVKVCRHYICNFIPDPVENENKYWIISCFPSTDDSPVRVSIWFPEVFNIHFGGRYYSRGKELQCMVFVHRDYIDKKVEKDIQKRTKGFQFVPGYRFVTGIEQQLAAFMPLKSYFSFADNETVFESIRAHNYELTRKGKTPFKKGHNYAFVRYLLGQGNSDVARFP